MQLGSKVQRGLPRGERVIANMAMEVEEDGQKASVSIISEMTIRPLLRAI